MASKNSGADEGAALATSYKEPRIKPYYRGMFIGILITVLIYEIGGL